MELAPSAASCGQPELSFEDGLNFRPLLAAGAGEIVVVLEGQPEVLIGVGKGFRELDRHGG